MNANHVSWRKLALLAMIAAASPASGQEGRYDDRQSAGRPVLDRRLDDRRYDNGEDGQRASADPPVDAAGAGGAVQTPPRLAERALRATEASTGIGQAVRDDRGSAAGDMDDRAAAGQPAGQPAGQATQRPATGANGPLVLAAPFQLDPQQQQFIDELLSAWEKHSAGIKTFECEFTRWEYTPLLGPLSDDGQLKAAAISSGVMKYIKPDKGLFQVTDTRIYNRTSGKYEKAGEDIGEHWICDGRVVWEIDARLKEIREHPIPPEMQGEQIANGPLPFMLFGGEAAKLKARYFLREQTHPQYAKEEIWLESHPRWAGDAVNYKYAHLIMKRADFLPYALRMYSNNGSDYTVFEFRRIRLNYVFTRDIKPPKVESDWKLIQAPPAHEAAQQQPAAAERTDFGPRR